MIASGHYFGEFVSKFDIFFCHVLSFGNWLATALATVFESKVETDRGL